MATDALLDAIVAAGARLGMAAEHIARVLFLESTLDPSAHRAGSQFSGLNQSTDAARREAGIPADVSARWTALAAAEQMQWVEQFIAYQVRATGGVPFATAGEYMAAQLAPAHAKAPRTPATVVLSEPALVRANAPLDTDGDGRITIANLDTFLEGVARRPDYAPVAARLAARQGAPAQDSELAIVLAVLVPSLLSWLAGARRR